MAWHLRRKRGMILGISSMGYPLDSSRYGNDLGFLIFSIYGVFNLIFVQYNVFLILDWLKKVIISTSV